MKICYIRWHDANYREATEPAEEVDASLSVLHAVGFLLKETDDAIAIGIELDGDNGETEPGRWRVNIPKAMIQQMKIVDLETFLKARSKKR